MRTRVSVAATVALLLLSTTARAEEKDAQALAKDLSNPVASLISVPFQFNYDHNIGPVEDGQRATMNFQPVVPISLGEDWNVIARVIVPVTWQSDIFPLAGNQFGLGDTLQSSFFSPKAPGPGGLIWGIGPALLLPTATDELLGGGKWAAGPTAVGLVQRGSWTIGALANHVWSFAGDEDRPGISRTFMQPFVAYTTAEAWTFTLNTETTYDWEAVEEHWSVPVNLQVSKVVKIGSQPVSFGAGLRYWAVSPDDVGPEGFGFRFAVTLLLPK